MQPTPSPAAWHPDPTGRYEFRYFNGERWTSDVSVGGQRYVDVLAPPAPGAHVGAGPTLVARPTGRGFALASFWVGLASMLFGWVPFVFAVAVPGAVAAAVFGIVALRRSGRAHTDGTVNQREGRGFALAGLVFSVLAVGASVAGFFLTRMVIREVDRYIDAGPHLAEIDDCATTDGLVTLSGTITNLSDRTRSYTVTVSYRVLGREVGDDIAEVDDVPAGERRSFVTTEFVDETVICEIDSITGPLPFGRL